MYDLTLSVCPICCLLVQDARVIFYGLFVFVMLSKFFCFWLFAACLGAADVFCFEIRLFHPFWTSLSLLGPQDISAGAFLILPFSFYVCFTFLFFVYYLFLFLILFYLLDLCVSVFCVLLWLCVLCFMFVMLLFLPRWVLYPKLRGFLVSLSFFLSGDHLLSLIVTFWEV